MKLCSTLLFLFSFSLFSQHIDTSKESTLLTANKIDETHTPLCSPMLNNGSDIFKEAFDRYDCQLNNGQGYSNYNNLNGILAWDQSYIMMSYLKMYRATNDLFYLKKLITHSINVIQQRDDHKARLDYRNLSNSAWSSNNPKYTTGGLSYTFVVHSGMISYPMADLAQLIINSPTLHNEISNEGSSFITIAEWLVKEIELTIMAHNDQWDSNIENYRFRTSAAITTSNEILPINQYAAMGRTLLMMYLATDNPTFLHKVTALANHFKSDLQFDAVNSSYTWNYGNGSSTEDISHAAIELDFALLCYQNGIVFKRSDIDRFSRTIMHNIYEGPLNFNDLVDGSGISNTYIHQVGRWLNLSKYDKNIYHAISEVYANLILNSQQKITSGSILLGITNCHYFKNYLSPIAYDNSSGNSSDWRGITTGDFDNDSIEEIVAVRNFDGQFYLYEFNDGEIDYQARSSFITSRSDWVDVISGDYNGDGKDEFIGVSNIDNEFHLFEYDDSLISLKRSSTHNINSNWNGITTLDINGDGKDEFVGLNSQIDQLILFEYKDDQIQMISQHQLNIQFADWSGITSGDYDNDGSDEIILVNDQNNQFYLFDHESNNFSYSLRSNHSFGNIKWKDISTGDFDGNGVHELVAIQSQENDILFFQLSQGQLKEYAIDYFPSKHDIARIGSGKLDYKEEDKDAILLIRSSDSKFMFYTVEEREQVMTVENLNSVNTKELVIKCYPNPVSQLFFIDLSTQSIDELTIEVIDQRGAKVPCNYQLKEGKVAVDVRNLNTGLYIIQLDSKDRQESVKFVKNH